MTHPADTTSTSRTPRADLAPDCRHYRGDKPCHKNQLCRGCNSYQPWTSRICIIKLGALGDVIRTLCILPALRKRYPNAEITWVSKANGCNMIAGHDLIDRVLEFNAVNAMVLARQTFDVVICLDKEVEPAALAMSMSAGRRLGVGLSEHGTPTPQNPEAQVYFHLGLSDDLKFRDNTKTYPQLIHEALGLTYVRQRYTLPTSDIATQLMASRLTAAGWSSDRPTIGINVGAGRVFANKMWPATFTTQVIAKLQKQQPEAQLLLLGGPDEQRDARLIVEASRRLGMTPPLFVGADFTEPDFVALVSHCDVLLSGDTMAMHVAIALGKQTVVFFGPTCEQEIDLFDRGEKLIARTACGPCYKRTCNHDDVCLSAFQPDDVADAVARAMGRPPARVSLPIHIATPERTHAA